MSGTDPEIVKAAVELSARIVERLDTFQLPLGFRTLTAYEVNALQQLIDLCRADRQ